MNKKHYLNLCVSLFLLFLTSLVFPAQSYADCVILLHGLTRSDASMKKMQSHLEAEGYDVVNVDYPSTKHPVEFLAENVIASGLEQCSPDETVHFVTHSVGGILVRQYLSEYDIPELGRVVMLGPPNQGSEAVDKFNKFPGFNFFTGDAGLQLGTGTLSLPNRLGRADFDVGIIAGTRTMNLFLSMLIPDEDDGKVSVERTKLEGMNDHIVMPVSHRFIMKKKEVIEQVVHYLEHGEFMHDVDTTSGDSGRLSQESSFQEDIN